MIKYIALIGILMLSIISMIIFILLNYYKNKIKYEESLKSRQTIKWIYICSPLSGDIENNIKKAIAYCKLAEPYGMPIAPHTIFTQFLDDNNLKQRKKGMEWGMELLQYCDELWVFGKPSEGMKKEIEWWELNHYLNDEYPIKYFDAKKI